MKKLGIIGIITILVFVVSISGCSNNYATYSANGVTFQYPSNWYAVNNNANMANIYDNSKPAGDGPSVFMVNATTNLSPNEYLDNESDVKIYKKNGILQNTTTIDGNTAYIYTFNGSGETNMYVGFQKNGLLYVIMMSCPIQDFARYQPDFYNVLNTMKLQ